MVTLPTPLRQLWNGWKRVSRAIGIALSFVVLTIVWLVAFGLYALILRVIRLFKKKGNPASYWRDTVPESAENLLHPF
jgi:hypothetical protein